MLTLYHTFSSTCSKKCRITLAEKDIEWQSHHINLGGFENLEPWYVKLNPNAVVPTIDHDGKVVIESNIIIEYLDDTFPGPSLSPVDTYLRARMRLVIHKSEEVVHKNINVISHNRRFLKRISSFSEEERQALYDKYPDAKRRLITKRMTDGVSDEDERVATDNIAAFMDELEENLKDGPWLAGADFTLADISIAPFVERFEVNEVAELIDWARRPRLGAWWQRMQEHPAYVTGMNFPNPGAKT